MIAQFGVATTCLMSCSRLGADAEVRETSEDVGDEKTSKRARVKWERVFVDALETRFRVQTFHVNHLHFRFRFRHN